MEVFSKVISIFSCLYVFHFGQGVMYFSLREELNVSKVVSFRVREAKCFHSSWFWVLGVDSGDIPQNEFDQLIYVGTSSLQFW